MVGCNLGFLAANIPADPSGMHRGCTGSTYDPPSCFVDKDGIRRFSCDLTGDGRPEEMAWIPYTRVYQPEMVVWFVNPQFADWRSRVKADISENGYLSFSDEDLPEKRESVSWYRAPGDHGVQIHDWIAVDGQPWLLEAFNIDLGPQGTYVTATTTTCPSQPYHRMQMMLDNGLSGPARKRITIPLAEVSALALYPSTIAADADRLFACIENGNETDCQAAAQVSPQAMVVVDRLRIFEAGHGADLNLLANSANYVAQMRSLQHAKRLLVDATLQPCVQAMESDLHRAGAQFADREALSQATTTLKSFDALFVGAHGDIQRIAEEWLINRYGLTDDATNSIRAWLVGPDNGHPHGG